MAASSITRLGHRDPPQGIDHCPDPGVGANGGKAAGDARYELGELLGRGGMGDVYASFDPQLGRRIALKLLRGDDPDQVRRFLREARAQAGIDHENVCKVYETGTLDGRPYIAMQHVDGVPLFDSTAGATGPSPALREMTLEQKLQVMEKVAEGIHAAHRQGLIHRDVKPSNIMVERREDGGWKPVVLDFGLAREVASQGVTSFGLAVGTPSFMAPEQVRGESGALDRRTDVYGLGATLYAVLAGRPPFEAGSSLDVMVKVTEEELPPLDGVPLDVATIVAKCLEKDPARRYGSARALADDLRRYLDSEPIAARRSSLGYRLWKKVKKNKALTGVSVAGITALLSVGAFSVRAEMRARERTQLAREFGQEVTGIETLMRIAEMLPRHDVTAERRIIRQRMADLEARIAELGEVAAGPGAYALGRGHLALGELDEARDRLEAAWRSGYREPGVAYALGLALGGLYRQELRQAERIRSEARREARKRQIETELRDPALASLRAGRGVEVESPGYVEALVAFYEKRYDDALATVRTARSSIPWLYEAATLEGDVLTAMARELWYRGDSEGAFDRLREAEAVYRQAEPVGRSDAEIYEGLCGLLPLELEIRNYGRGGDVRGDAQRGIEACQQALEVDPESLPANRYLAAIYFRLGEAARRQRADARPDLERAIEASRQVLALDPDDVEASYSTGVAYSILSQDDQARGEDPRPSLAASNQALERLLEIDPNHGAAVTVLGVNHYLWAEYEAAHGGDPTAHYDAAVARLESVLDDATIRYQVSGNLAELLASRGSWELRQGQDPTATLTKGVEAAEAAIALSPETAHVYGVLADLRRLAARYAMERGSDPAADLAAAIDAAGSVLAINPDAWLGWWALADSYLLQAEQARRSGDSPEAALARGREAVAKLLEIDPDSASARAEQGWAAEIEARWKAAAGASPEAVLDRGLAALEESLRIDPQEAEPRRLLGELHRRRAEWRLGRGGDVEGPVAEGLAAAERALAIDPRLARAHALRAALLYLRSRIDRRHAAANRAAAAAALDRAFSLNGRLRRENAELTRALAASRPGSD